ncbi:MAG: type II toxin-antitoxin system VapC family toxin, partial [Rhizobiales bacterium]|nr:type II toxin-antitoxin system VapC family toxin [Hyphomicrobiales bacterium]
DTNICIYVMRNQPLSARERFDGLRDRLCVSSITIGELCFGVEKSARRQENRARLVSLRQLLPALPFGAEAAEHYGQMRAAVEAIGRPVGLHDLQIGAHARSLGLTIVTNNTREFERMPGVKVENWV